MLDYTNFILPKISALPNSTGEKIIIKHSNKEDLKVKIFDLAGREKLSSSSNLNYNSEKGYYEFHLYLADIYTFKPDGKEIMFFELWIEDSLKHRYKIKNSKKDIKKLLEYDKEK